ncbi:hypothetical protein C731_2976 [Mycolicibacterium hassiacum DSM 44199]|uniref:Uncharacterized protein n=1 Tax=Mycolicibacterium hassiacum (strain DSM 44199 / CIP 105218 / JCM 12690 / 3849) TaxID=1122247 RepID=K5B828_MYCHD|nr:hypothetical protein [Mycolicibacterium hassiacum]EKF22973.1 hypothetical protein C731_2976 [Mycolicibacterium hassiacum DSM 44199]MDA4086037.1 hypothetical protein [Mycolicibacterium hassiacum DSM 44199]VCT89494.1 hypothetical protein MHAS_01188 [Mycolicibacterium hassiacum DSM 44199]
MTITTAVNEAKEDLDVAMGELRRLTLLLERLRDSDIPDFDQIGEALSVATFKVRRVRSSL